MTKINSHLSKDEWYFENYEKNSVFLFGPLNILEKDIIEFAKLYDPQPFHIDPNVAKNGPYKGIIASGWHTCALVMRTLVENYFSTISSIGSPGIDELRWLFPVRPGDKLSVRVSVLGTRRSQTRPDRGIVKTFVEVINQEELIVMSFRSVNFILCKKSF